MPKLPEHRCPDCGALYNIEACDQAIHSALSARKAERQSIVQWLRSFRADHTNRLADELEALPPFVWSARTMPKSEPLISPSTPPRSLPDRRR